MNRTWIATRLCQVKDLRSTILKINATHMISVQANKHYRIPLMINNQEIRELNKKRVEM